jgi:hypothetical protein
LQANHREVTFPLNSASAAMRENENHAKNEKRSHFVGVLHVGQENPVNT